MALYVIPCASKKVDEQQSINLNLYVNADSLVEAINKVKDDYEQIQTAQVVGQFRDVKYPDGSEGEVMSSYSVGYPDHEELVFARSIEELTTMMTEAATGFSMYTETCAYIK